MHDFSHVGVIDTLLHQEVHSNWTCPMFDILTVENVEA